jgi:predicted transposase YbfD/YdcC
LPKIQRDHRHLQALADVGEGAVVPIAAMGCQRDIAQTIIDKKADYILVLKSQFPRAERT